MWQAQHVRGQLARLYRGATIDLLGMTTRGDRVLDRPLAEIGGKGLFIKELEMAMADGRADLAVHSLKDVPMDLPEGFVLAAVMAREDPRDAFVSNTYATFADLPAGAIVGTSSTRREVQLRARFPALVIKPLRGNVNTRLAKLDAGDYDAIVLAAAGLKRLSLDERIRELVDIGDSIPAPGQGALGIECRSERADLVDVLAPLADAGTTIAVTAERAFARTLFGNCQTPMGAHAEWLGDTLWLRGFIASPDGSEMLRGEDERVVATADEAHAQGVALASDLLARGAHRFVQP
ncbi:MAG: hydroxymethylbilane synthase [Proteobacteria bacterium]|nr:hydroxymethylbilane synthase [Pseudomonadota bacterium]